MWAPPCLILQRLAGYLEPGGIVTLRFGPPRRCACGGALAVAPGQAAAWGGFCSDAGDGAAWSLMLGHRVAGSCQTDSAARQHLGAHCDGPHCHLVAAAIFCWCANTSWPRRWSWFLRSGAMGGVGVAPPQRLPWCPGFHWRADASVFRLLVHLRDGLFPVMGKPPGWRAGQPENWKFLTLY